MKRILESEIMDKEELVLAYAEADYSVSNQEFVDRLFDNFQLTMSKVLDIGCGPADIPIRIVKKKPAIHVAGVDASQQMLDIAIKEITKAGFEDHIMIHYGRIPGLVLENNDFDTIISKDLLHHLPIAKDFWGEIKRLSKLANQSINILIKDLYRPTSIENAKHLKNTVTKDEPEILQVDFYNSLLAAYSIEEVKNQLVEENLSLNVEVVSNRHFVVIGRLQGESIR